MTGPAPYGVDWLPRRVPLWPSGHCQLMVVGVARDADPAVRNYWLKVGREQKPAKG